MKKQSKENIVEKAYTLFHRKGYQATSMSDIASVAGMTKAGLYHHFEGKEALLLAVLEKVKGYMEDQLFSLAYSDNPNATERLKAFVAQQEKILLANQGACFIGNMALETARLSERNRELLYQIFKDWKKALAHMYAYSHPGKDADLLAEQTVIEFEGAVMLCQLEKNNKVILVRAMERAIARGL
jgi:TetR/AcrR family transcriptional repressor of nem operon